MQLSATATTILVVWYAFGSLVNIVLLAVLALALRKVQAKLTELDTTVAPLLSRAEETLKLANSQLASIGGSAEAILAHGEGLAATLESKTETTSDAVQRAVYAPLIGAESLAAGAARAFTTFGRRQSQVLRDVKDVNQERKRAKTTRLAAQAPPAGGIGSGQDTTI